jgi:hypothetical protein
MTTPPRKVSAIQKLQRSKLSPAEVQRELMGDDLDLETLLIYLKSKVKFDSVDRVQDISVTRTVEGASTVVVTLIDTDRAILRSGLLNSKLDIDLNGLWFRLVKVEKMGDILSLTFEDREIALLRTYNKLKLAHRSKVTRAEFINNLINEVKEEDIPVVIPQLHTVQAIQVTKDIGFGTETVDKTPGIPEDINTAQDLHRHNEATAATANFPHLTVKGDSASRSQIETANIILQTGSSMGVRRKLLVCAIMTAIVESSITNLPYGDLDSLGVFQQRASWGSVTERLDVATSARKFFNKAVLRDNEVPNATYGLICQEVQVSAFPDRYETYKPEAEVFVQAFGIPGGDNPSGTAGANNSFGVDQTGADYIFYRGIPQDAGKTWKKENSWDCIQRLASEVQVRAFFVSGVFYYITEDELFSSKPVAIIGEYAEGVEGLDGDYDQGKGSGQVTLTCRVGTWLVPPGALITLIDMGPWNGRWLVNDFQRSLFSSKATITLKKPRPKLPEPIQNDFNTMPTWGSTDPAVPDPVDVGPAFGGILDPSLVATRSGIVSIAEEALAVQATKPYLYKQTRPYPITLWSAEAHAGIDCSSFVTLVYKEAGCQDPNDKNFNGSGYTGTLWANGIPTFAPQPGDLAFYKGDGSSMAPGHVAIYVGGGQVIEIGSSAGVSRLTVNYRSDLMGYRSYFQ